MCFSERRYRRPEERREYRTPPPRADVRVSDADRHRVIDQLRAHTADGRLTLDEFEERVGEAWNATTHGELRSVLRDLPDLERRPRSRPQRTRPGAGIPVPLLVAALVVVGSLLMSHFAWWLIPVGFFAFGGCGGHHQRHADRQETAWRREDTPVSV